MKMVPTEVTETSTLSIHTSGTTQKKKIFVYLARLDLPACVTWPMLRRRKQHEILQNVISHVTFTCKYTTWTSCMLNKKCNWMSDDRIMKRKKNMGWIERNSVHSDSLFLDKRLLYIFLCFSYEEVTFMNLVGPATDPCTSRRGGSRLHATQSSAPYPPPSACDGGKASFRIAFAFYFV
jgi:hypothetical protein